MFAKIENFFDGLFNTVEPIPAGVYKHQASPDAAFPYKIHLRVEPDGTGILIINASTVLHLNQTAVEYAYYFIKGTKKEDIPPLVAARFDVSVKQSQRDMEEFLSKIDTLIHTEDLDPVTYLGIDRVEPYSQNISAPYRLDCALTYRVSDGMDANTAPTKRVERELSTDEWKQILKRAFGAGIPHVIFTGGEPTLREDLPDLIATAEDLSIVCGLLTDGIKFSNKKYMNDLLQKGLDHIMLLCQAENTVFWKALKNLISADISVTVHITLNSKNQKSIPALLEKLAKEKVTSVSLSAESLKLSDGLAAASQKASDLYLHQVWDLPVPYSSFHPVAIELESDTKFVPKGAGKAWLYVEPDGDVLPAQGINKVLGNILTDPWKKIWKHR
ncbi:MAG: radical SAM protein [Anaerolineaceae bacterium]|nr:radical SAM protein [Anaerolineaceae bacterium]